MYSVASANAASTSASIDLRDVHEAWLEINFSGIVAPSKTVLRQERSPTAWWCAHLPPTIRTLARHDASIGRGISPVSDLPANLPFLPLISAVHILLTMSSEGYPRRTLHLPHSDVFARSVHYMDHNDRAYLSYEKAKAIGLSYGMFYR